MQQTVISSRVTPSKKQANRKSFSFKKLLIRLAIFAFAGVLLYVVLHYFDVRDRILAIGYAPTEQVRVLKSDIELTDRGRIIFNASWPTIKDRDEFNIACQSYNPKIAVLGCFAGEKIFLFNIDNPDLDGIKQTTLAHELLHAVWARMSDRERREVAEELHKVLENSPNRVALETHLSFYEESMFDDELHSIIGTKERELTPRLEEHFARYFRNRNRIVDFYEQYSAKLDQLEAETQRLRAELDAKKVQIDQRNAEYATRIKALNERIANFNNCASTAGCFASQAAFDSARAELVAENSTLNAFHQSLNASIDEYNKLIEQFNATAVGVNNLMDSMNSNSDRPASID